MNYLICIPEVISQNYEIQVLRIQMSKKIIIISGDPNSVNLKSFIKFGKSLIKISKRKFI